MYCANCGKEIKTQTKFCTACGKPLTGDSFGRNTPPSIKKESAPPPNPPYPVPKPSKAKMNPAALLIAINAALAALMVILIVMLAAS